MSQLDHLIIAANLLGCLFAICANVCAAHVGFLVHRTLASVVAVIASGYLVGYGLLLAGTIEVAQWSAFFRGVSVVVWPVVWAGPAIVSLLAWRHTSREVRAAVGRAADERSDLRS